jgi:hypothetical protein
MEFLLGFDAPNKLLYLRFEGAMTDEDLLDGFAKARLWIATNGPQSSISDFTGVTSFDVTSEAVRILASLPPLVPDDYHRIVVAPHDVVYGMVRVFAAFGSKTRNQVEIVRSLDEALEILGLASLNWAAATCG